MISPKKRPGCLEFTGLGTTICVLTLPETMHMVFTERQLARAVFAGSIKVIEWQLVSEKSREHDSPIKFPVFF